MYSVNIKKIRLKCLNIFQLYLLDVFFNNIGKNINSESCFPCDQDFNTNFKILYVSSYNISNT